MGLVVDMSHIVKKRKKKAGFACLEEYFHSAFLRMVYYAQKDKKILDKLVSI